MPFPSYKFSRKTTAELLRLALPMVVSQGTFAVMIFTDRYFMSQIDPAHMAAALGGGVGALAAYLAFNGYRAATINWDTFSQVTFAFAVTPELMLQGLVYSLALGLVGGLFPAVRAARQPVATALRQL